MVAITIGSERSRRIQNTNQRLDLPAVRAFVDDVVPVP
jgi:hypothetical protein